MYPFSSQHGTHRLGVASSKDAFDTIRSFPQKYHHHRAEGTYWECRLIHQTSEGITLQLIDKNFELPRGPAKHSGVPCFRLQLCEEAAETVLHYTYLWKRWKLLLVAVSFLILSTALVYTVFAFSQLSSRDIHLFLLLWSPTAALLLYWLISNHRHDKLTLHVFKALLNKNFPNT